MEQGPTISDIYRNLKLTPLHCEPVGGLTTDVSENIFRMMEGPGIRRSKKKSDYLGVREGLVEDIRSFVNKGEPIKISFIAFPFKSPDLMSTIRDYPDLGELMAIAQLLKINETIKLVYTPGASFELFCESYDYLKRGVFNDINQDRANYYRQGLESIISGFGVENRIQLTDLEILTSQFDNFSNCHINNIEKLSTAGLQKDQIRLSRGIMALSLNSEALLNQGFSVDDLYKLDLGLLDGDLRLANAKEVIYQKACDLTIRYEAYHATRSELGTTKAYLKDNHSVYVVVREHVGRFAIHLSNPPAEYYPHNGVAVLDKQGNLKIKRMADLMVNPDGYVGVTCEGDIEETPFYFREEK